MSGQEEDEFRGDLESSELERTDTERAHLWSLALSRLYLHGDPTKIIELLRQHVPPAEHQYEFLADLLDPSKAEGQFWQVTFIKSRRAFRKSDTNWELLKVGNKVLDAEAAGEKRYVAVERIAKELSKSERYVWKALALAENPTKLLESED
jgi:hypothetical protein